MVMEVRFSLGILNMIRGIIKSGTTTCLVKSGLIASDNKILPFATHICQPKIGAI